jgi:hypothetical protein
MNALELQLLAILSGMREGDFGAAFFRTAGEQVASAGEPPKSLEPVAVVDPIVSHAHN